MSIVASVTNSQPGQYDIDIDYGNGNSVSFSTDITSWKDDLYDEIIDTVSKELGRPVTLDEVIIKKDVDNE